MSDLNCSLSALYVHPIKSCAGVAPAASPLVETGLEYDREWMVVDAASSMLTQRELPRMALVRPAFKGGDLVLRAPGMLALHLSLDAVEGPTRARVWHDEVAAFDMGPLAAQWFSDFLGRPARLVRFDPDQKRLSSPQWTGEIEAPNAFADGFPLLVANSASLADLNRRLAGRGVPPVAMQRFRPNLVIDGLAAWDEDHIDEIIIDAGEGPVVLRLVKPCTRCSIPNVDPESAATSNEPGDTLTTFRSDPRMKGGITFGINAVVVEGIERTLRPGQRGKASWKFD